MAKLLIFFFALVIVINTTNANGDDIIEEEQLKIVQKHNADFEKGKTSFKMKVNVAARKLLALTSKSKNIMNEFRSLAKNIKQCTYKPCVSNVSEEVPASFDWRKRGAVTEVGFQGNCSSCWTFAVAGALEGFYKIKTGNLVRLSQQYLLDCSDYAQIAKKEEDKCKTGNFPQLGLEFVRKNGICLADSYPYTAKSGKCDKSIERTNFYAIKDIKQVKNDEETMKEALYSNGPLVAGVYALENSFELYEGGVYYEKNCWEGRMHTVLIVGYGHDELQGDYWIIKNSWGRDWGEDGYMKLARNRDRHCGISFTVYLVK
ncbi:procathepsin L-like [Sitodiplosis mosellana]|uniref:procathepsin L-like n=1 Tax=Sitodiplosis mosellana TaxID=263140 RepID=UPI002444AE2E|nr:procathepsin L-like [Sitodiplosis mosellana]